MPTAYRWDAKAQRYRDASGAFVSRVTVRRAVDAVIQKSESRARALANQLRTGALSTEDWASAMRAEIKRQHLTAAAAAKGGWAQMTAADYGVVGQRLRVQYRYLNGFAAQIAAGLPLDGSFVTRAGMYEQAARSTYHDVETRGMQSVGWDLQFNIFGDAKHCTGCLFESARGDVPIGTLKPIGSRTCLVRCKCRKGYRNSVTGATAR